MLRCEESGQDAERGRDPVWEGGDAWPGGAQPAASAAAANMKSVKELIFGKSVIALWPIAQRQVSTLILVHRKQLMDQWVEIDVSEEENLH